ncbi:hypothetical protein Ddye_011376 [Dipteronia dyeriana]|uniref:Uncharacterized protein n=1 Tax=Dipteronia dyeriana TaxID=168575 RepID=A0AAE0CGV2_9ROSI|nr:hypothetical protein Ddye_011376 [Dipteronia dyeriana]
MILYYCLQGTGSGKYCYEVLRKVNLVFCGDIITSKMPKDRRVQSLSFDRSRASPYPCCSSSRDAKQYKNGLLSGSLEDTKEWEEARCPICLEHPHNAVLMQCSSSEKGCRPYMCDTSYRHSNCLDQFKTLESTPSNETVQENPPTGLNPSKTKEEASLPRQSKHCMRLLPPNLRCPLCRGEIYGCIVVENARRFMNSKVRSCSCENCDFSGTYPELRKHARSDHPSIRPSEVDPAREENWEFFERIRGFRDFLSFMRPNNNSLDDPSNICIILLGTYLIHEVEEYLYRNLHTEQLNSNLRSLRFRHNMYINHNPRHRWSRDRQSLTYGGRYNMDTNLDPTHDPRWNYHLQEESANHGRYNVETNRDPRSNDSLPTQRTNNSQGLLWRGRQMRQMRSFDNHQR